MNIFYLHEDPKISATMHLDKHVVKMPTEYAQLLSTSHRVLDGKQYLYKNTNGRTIKRWKLDDIREHHLYKATHINHPSAVWARSSSSNYQQLYLLYMSVLEEFTYRYGKIHGASKPSQWLQDAPLNIQNTDATSLPQAMPEYCKVENDSVGAYRKYYRMEKKDFATWSGKVNSRQIPSWFKQ